MTKKHYIDIAQQFAKTIADVELENDEGTPVVLRYIDSLAQRIANVCERDNPRFDRAKFIEACNEGREVN